jgi:small subunit ribosomal protein S8
MMTDSIADLLTRIRNASHAKHDQVVVPYSKLREKVATILKEEGFLNGVAAMGEKNKKSLVIKLKYAANNKPAFSELAKASKSSRRIYLKKDEIKSVRYGRGVAIISTSKGVMKDADAKKKGVGGELLCTVW